MTGLREIPIDGDVTGLLWLYRPQFNKTIFSVKTLCVIISELIVKGVSYVRANYRIWLIQCNQRIYVVRKIR